mmetsp:Transcript_33750/g.87707  ORF Transcript_33750/g.87707 Transcript_33750/m.87707 type:complete len:457 (+) Transcript_33750:313-1683(+)
MGRFHGGGVPLAGDGKTWILARVIAVTHPVFRKAGKRLVPPRWRHKINLFLVVQGLDRTLQAVAAGNGGDEKQEDSFLVNRKTTLSRVVLDTEETKQSNWTHTLQERLPNNRIQRRPHSRQIVWIRQTRKENQKYLFLQLRGLQHDQQLFTRKVHPRGNQPQGLRHHRRQQCLADARDRHHQALELGTGQRLGILSRPRGRHIVELPHAEAGYVPLVGVRPGRVVDSVKQVISKMRPSPMLGHVRQPCHPPPFLFPCTRRRQADSHMVSNSGVQVQRKPSCRIGRHIEQHRLQSLSEQQMPRCSHHCVPRQPELRLRPNAGEQQAEDLLLQVNMGVGEPLDEGPRENEPSTQGPRQRPLIPLVHQAVVGRLHRQLPHGLERCHPHLSVLVHGPGRVLSGYEPRHAGAALQEAFAGDGSGQVGGLVVDADILQHLTQRQPRPLSPVHPPINFPSVRC